MEFFELKVRDNLKNYAFADVTIVFQKIFCLFW